MQHDESYKFDSARHHAAISLKPEHIPDFQRLVKELRIGSRFQFLIVEFNNDFYRRELIARIDDVLSQVGLHSGQLILSPETHADFRAVEDDLRGLAIDCQAIHILGGESWFDPDRWQAFNIRREAVAQGVPVCLIFWLTAPQIAYLAKLAPDLWAWRGGIFSFSTTETTLREAPTAQLGPVDPRTLAERSKRIAVLREYLNVESPLDDEIRLPLLDEMAELYQSIGQLDEALRIRQEEELPVYERLGDVRSKAVTMGQIADILQSRGQLDEALRLLKDEVLFAFERLGDVRSKAVTMGKIADILWSRGQLDEALRLLNNEVLVAFERLGDVRSKAMTMGKIADIFQSRGQLDEALRIRQEEELPVYERLGDVREKAVTMGQIADILQSRGQLDEALRIRQEEELPVYERLGDVRSKAVTMGKIADIAESRGQLDEALRIRQEEELPVYERLGDVRSKAMTMGQIADILQSRGQLDEALRLLNDEVLVVFERLGDVRSKAVTMGIIADILQSRGQLDEALALHEQQLPIAERLGDIDSIAHIKFSTASLRLQRGDHQTEGIQSIRDDLAEAFAISRKLGRPDAIGWIGQLLAQVLVMLKEKEAALAVLQAAEEAFVMLGNDKEVASLHQLREQIAALA